MEKTGIFGLTTPFLQLFKARPWECKIISTQFLAVASHILKVKPLRVERKALTWPPFSHCEIKVE